MCGLRVAEEKGTSELWVTDSDLTSHCGLLGLVPQLLLTLLASGVEDRAGQQGAPSLSQSEHNPLLCGVDLSKNLPDIRTP